MRIPELFGNYKCNGNEEHKEKKMTVPVIEIIYSKVLSSMGSEFLSVQHLKALIFLVKWHIRSAHISYNNIPAISFFKKNHIVASIDGNIS